MSFCTFKGGEVYKDHWKTGVYVCSKCENELFSSQQKVAHSSPWPAFSQPIHEGSITKYLESPNAWKVKCGKCDQGLGHEFTGSHSGNPDGEPRF